MPDRKISELPSRTVVEMGDQFVNLAQGVNYRSPISSIIDLTGGVPGPPGPAGDVRFVDSIDEMRALPGLNVGSVVFVGQLMDQFVVVNEPGLGADGGTVFIPNSELSEIQEHAITPWNYFHIDRPTDLLDILLYEYQLPHAGLDFESMEWVLGDDGEKLTVYDALHGHVYQPGWLVRTECPQLPLVDFARGAIRDPDGRMTAVSGASYPNYPPVRTGGVLIRYRYATSGLRLKRVVSDVYKLSWWRPIAVDEEAPGTESDNTGKICWCFNAAARANARVVLVDKMYNYAGAVEVPDGLEVRGRGIGISGFRVMKDGAFKELLLTSNSHTPSLWKEYEYYPSAPATRYWSWDAAHISRAVVFLPATGAKRIRLVDLEWDGNLANNLGVFEKKGPSRPGANPHGGPNGIYAYGFAQNGYIWNTTTYSAFSCTTQANRVIAGLALELHNIKMHGYMHLILVSANASVFGTGLVEMGDVPTGHWTYLADGDYETIRCFGCASGDGMRIQNFNAQTAEFRPYSPPDVMFSLADEPYPTKHPTDPNLPGPNSGDIYRNQGVDLMTYGEWATQQQSAGVDAPFPKLSTQRINIDNLFVDASGLDTFPAGKIPFGMRDIMGKSGDNIHIGSGKVRLPSQSSLNLFVTGGNNVGGHPHVNNVFENLSIEYHSRQGISLMSGANYHNAQFRNITLQPRASTHIINKYPSGAGGVSILLGNMRCKAVVAAEPPLNVFADGGRKVDFAAAGSLAGKHIDVTPADPGAPTFRIWFDYNNASTAPSATGVTLIEADVGAAPTPAQLAAAFSNAIDLHAVAKTYLTAATFNTVSVIGSFSIWQSELGSLPVVNVAAAPGVTNAMRASRRNFEPSVVNFHQVLAPDPIFMFLIALWDTADRDITLNFRECTFGAASSSYITAEGHNGSFNVPAVLAARDRLHFNFEDTVFDLREEFGSWTNLDLMLYAGKYRGCRVRTPVVHTGVSVIGTGYEVLVSEQSGMEVWTTPSSAVPVLRDVQTKLFWLPKDGNLRLYPGNAATAAIWNTVWPEWWRSSRPVGGALLPMTPSASPGGPYYTALQDRRAPVLRLNFTSAPPVSTELKIGWAAAVSP